MIATAVRPAARRRFVEHTMGMPISLALRGRHADTPTGALAWAETMAALRWVDVVFSTYRSDSWVSRLARHDVELSDCPPEVAEVLELGDEAALASGGAFTVYRRGADGAPRLDPTGVVKGWAVDLAAGALRRLPDTDFCLSAGGDLVCHTVTPDAEPWRIGIEDPADPQQVVAVVPVVNGAVATSGTAHRGQHLVDGRTGLPPTGVASVTVVAPTLTAADLDATSAYARGPEAAVWLRSRTDRTGLVVWADGTTTTIGATDQALTR